jgi:DNA-binding CsgD family transcriptional regulator
MSLDRLNLVPTPVVISPLVPMLSQLHSSTLSTSKPTVTPKAGGFSTASNAAKDFFNAVMEGFYDGIMILNHQGNLFHINQRALELCNLLTTQTCHSAAALPPCLGSMCQQMIESRDLFPDHTLVLTQTLDCIERRSVRVRVQWLELEAEDSPYLLIMLEDQTETAKAAALLESVQFGLTPRETEVWILRSINYSYDEIAEELFIALNTVKRHLKSIYAKRKDTLGDTLDYAEAR